MRITNYLKKQLNSSLVKKAIIKYADSNYKLMQQIIISIHLYEKRAEKASAYTLIKVFFTVLWLV